MSEEKAEVQEEVGTKVSEITLEDAKKKIAELEAQLNPPKPSPEELKKQQAEYEKQYKYFQDMSRGAGFIKFIIADLMTNRGYNRAKRRRLVDEMMKKEFSREFVENYSTKVDNILAYIEENFNHLHAQDDIKKGDRVIIRNGKVINANKTVAPVDAKELLEQVKKEESQVAAETKTEEKKDEVV